MSDAAPSRGEAKNHRPHGRLVAVLFGIFLAVTAWSGYAPWHRADWLLENMLCLLALPVLWVIYRRLPFSMLSWSLVFSFLCLHQLGAHYTYSEVPYDTWWQSLTGHSLNQWFGWDRNHFDRMVHVLYGFLLAYPIREIFLQLVPARGFWSYFLPLDLTLSSSALYELIEWAAAGVFGGELGAAYLGTQGDPWDAQKDMALAAGGALLAMLITAVVHWRCQRDFAREWTTSLTPRGAAPPLRD
jgi:putative membrane protein